ncbi:hypothetical protein BGZ49_010071 [Haplosporangium sp. Z 27]|nr:hypothetical protein BGZ49_010071 [Haplosporangium sp. Z 27]
MFGIPEIDILVLTRINQHDLVQCSRVSKQWHRISIPYIWSDISSIPHYRKGAFRRIVLEDYLHGRQQQDTQHPITNNLPTTLQKYSHWIQKLPSPETLYYYFESSENRYGNVSVGEYKRLVKARREMAAAKAENPTVTENPTATENPTVTPIEPMRHLLRRCSDVDVNYVHLDAEIYDFPELSAIASEYFLPLAQNVTGGRLHYMTAWVAPMEARRIKSFLNRCSHKLRKLKIGFNVPIEDSESDHTEENNEKENMEEEESTSGLRPIELILAEYCERSNRKEFWTWLWKRCGPLELLDLRRVSCKIQNLAEGVRNHMPNLQKIRLGSDHWNWEPMKDNEVTALLSSCHKG